MDQRFTAIIFDLYGTLVDFSAAAFLQTLKRMETALAVPQRWQERFRSRITEMEFGRLAVAEAIRGAASETRRSASPISIKEAEAIWEEHVWAGLYPRLGTTELAEELLRRGFQLGLISNVVPTGADLWKRSMLAPYFSVAGFSAHVGLRKPDPQIYEQAARLLRTEPSQCLFIGDGSNNELTGAINAGMAALQIRVTHEDSETVSLLRREQWSGPVAESFNDILNLADFPAR